jgi:hypothetical protein
LAQFRSALNLTLVTCEPDSAASEVYAALFKEFVILHEKTKSIHKRLNGGRLVG